MHHLVSRRTSILLAALLASLAIACGGSKPAPTPTPSATPSVSATPSSTAAAATPTPAIAPPIALTGDACQDWPAVHQRSVVIITGVQSQLQRGVPQFIDDITKYQKTVPEPQRADVAQFVTAWTGVRQALDGINYDLLKFGDAPVRAAMAKTGDASMAAGLTRLDTWAQGCRGGKPTPTP